ncbi:enoyl-CoA hydratase/isomerase family protein [bacterium]|nr:enoyl-CoA hydratase/isomerase family protein [bacterium]
MLNSFKFLKINYKNGILNITLNNPKKHNALNPLLIRDLEKIFIAAQKNKKIKIVCLKSSGKNFCAGADLNWMAAAANLSSDENYKDMLKLVRMYNAILNFKRPIVAQIKGLALGGGVGLACSADVVICETNTVFRMPEVKLGLIPGIISPIVTRKIGAKAFKHYGTTGLPITSSKAAKLGLATHVTTNKNLNKKTNEVLKLISQNSYDALVEVKRILNNTDPIKENTLKKWAKASAAKRKSKKFQNLK